MPAVRAPGSSRCVAARLLLAAGSPAAGWARASATRDASLLVTATSAATSSAPDRSPRSSGGSDTVMRLLQRNAPTSRRASAAASCSRSTGSPAVARAAARSTGSSTSTGIESRQGRDRRQGPRRRPHLVGSPRLGGDAATSRPSSARSPSRSLHGADGKRCPVALECADDAERRLRRPSPTSSAPAGVGAARQALGTSFVGEHAAHPRRAWSDAARRSDALAQLERGPAAAASTPARGRRQVASRCSISRGSEARTLGAGAGPDRRDALRGAGADLGRHRHRRRPASPPRRARSTRARCTATSRSRSDGSPRSAPGAAGAPMSYRRRASPLHAARAAAGARWCAALALAALAARASARARRASSLAALRGRARAGVGREVGRSRCCWRCRSRCRRAHQHARRRARA